MRKYISSIDDKNEPEEAPDFALLNPIDTKLSDIEYDALENLAGYICHKLKQPDASTSTVSTSSYT